MALIEVAVGEPSTMLPPKVMGLGVGSTVTFWLTWVEPEALVAVSVTVKLLAIA